jgi:hypothetical protein
VGRKNAEQEIAAQEQVQREAQQTFENQMRNLKAQESLAGAGINKGPISNIIDRASLEEQGAVARGAMEEAQAAAAKYKAELNGIEQEMVRLNTSTQDGAARFLELEAPMKALQRAMGDANNSAGRWKATLEGIQAKEAELDAQMKFSWQSIGVSIENASEAGWQSFNSAFLKMMAGGMSFGRMMQTMWTSMVDSIVSSILKMAEYYVEKYVIMAAVTWAFQKIGLSGAGVTTAQTTADQAERQAAIGAAAAEAALNVAMLGPAAMLAAAAEVEVGLQAITSAERGGIVRTDLHEGEMVLPAHISTFVQTAAAGAAMGGAGGPGGRGGPGGAGGAAGHTFNFYHTGSGDSGDMRKAGRDFMKLATRELRRLNLR